MEIDLGRVLDDLPAMVWTAQPGGHIDFVNRRWSEYTGLSLGEAHGWEWQAVIEPDNLPEVLERWRSILASGKSGEIESRVRRSDGQYRRLLVRCSPIRDDAGRIIQWCGVASDIEDLRRAEENLRRPELDVQLIVDSIPIPVAVTTPSGEIEGLNQPTLDYFGKTFEELKGWKASDVVHPDDLEQTIAAQLDAHQKGSAYSVESRHRRADGVYQCYKVLGLPLRDPQGRILRWFHLLIDIDDRKRAEEALRISESNLKLLIDTIPDLVWSARPDGNAEFLSQHYLDYLGLSAEQVLDWGWSSAVHPDDLNGLDAMWQTILASGKPGEAEARLRRYDGEYRWFLFRANPLRDESGSIVKWYGVNTDIEDRKRAETQLAGDKRLLEMVALGRPLREVLNALCRFVEEAAPGCHCGVYPIDWRGLTFQFGAAPSLPASYTDAIEGLPVRCDMVPCGIAALQKTQVIVADIELDPRWQGTEFRTLFLAHGLKSIWSTPIYSLEGRVLGTFCIYHRYPASPSLHLRDLIGQVTHIASIAIEHSRIEAALRRSETLLAEGQRLSQTGSFSWQPDTNEVVFSEELRRIFEIDPTSPLTLDLITSRVHPLDLPLVQKNIGVVRTGGNDLDYEVRLQMPDGRIKYLHTFARRVVHSDGRLEFLGAILDITRRRVAEEALSMARSELAHVSRVTSLGALTASIAHEVSQPLSGIVTNAGTCLRMLAGDAPNLVGARETARRTIRDANRAADVITRLRALFSRKAVVIQAVDLNEAVREVIALSWVDLQRSLVHLRTELDDGIPPVGGDRVQLQQVIMNLLRNAADAMSGVDDRPRRLVIRTEPEEDDHVRLSVEDAGVGFGPQGTERLFEAFYTTKSDGMGIGLSISRSIIESHDGRLWAAPNDDTGARFAFSIPRYPNRMPPGALQNPSEPGKPRVQGTH